MEIKVLTVEQLTKLIYNGKNLPNSQYEDDLNNIHFFSFDDLSYSCFANELYRNSLRFVVGFDNEHIYGILKFAYYQMKQRYTIGYCSTNENFTQKGICNDLVDKFCKYFPKKYKGTDLYTSEYTVSGWKYLRPTLIKKCNQYNVNYKDNIVGYPDKKDGHTPEFYHLLDLSRKIVGVNYNSLF